MLQTTMKHFGQVMRMVQTLLIQTTMLLLLLVLLMSGGVNVVDLRGYKPLVVRTFIHHQHFLVRGEIPNRPIMSEWILSYRVLAGTLMMIAFCFSLPMMKVRPFLAYMFGTVRECIGLPLFLRMIGP